MIETISRLPAVATEFLLPRNVESNSVVHSTVYIINTAVLSRDQSSRDVKLYRMPSVRISGAVLLLPSRAFVTCAEAVNIVTFVMNSKL